VRRLDWSDVYATADVNDPLHSSNSSILTLFDNHVKLRCLRPRNRINPWSNMTNRKANCERDICHGVWKVFLDFSKAFDTVSHDLLYRKLHSLFNFSDSAVQLVRSYLTDRTQCVSWNDIFSSFFSSYPWCSTGLCPWPTFIFLFTFYERS
jgi:hypothetical protein